MFEAAITLLVICFWELFAFQSAQKWGTENKSLLLHVLIVSVQAITQVPSSTSQNKFSHSFKAVMDLSTFCQSCSVCRKSYKWLYFQKNILLLLSVLNRKRS